MTRVPSLAMAPIASSSLPGRAELAHEVDVSATRARAPARTRRRRLRAAARGPARRSGARTSAAASARARPALRGSEVHAERFPPAGEPNRAVTAARGGSRGGGDRAAVVPQLAGATRGFRHPLRDVGLGDDEHAAARERRGHGLDGLQVHAAQADRRIRVGDRDERARPALVEAEQADEVADRPVGGRARVQVAALEIGRELGGGRMRAPERARLHVRDQRDRRGALGRGAQQRAQRRRAEAGHRERDESPARDLLDRAHDAVRRGARGVVVVGQRQLDAEVVAPGLAEREHVLVPVTRDRAAREQRDVVLLDGPSPCRRRASVAQKQPHSSSFCGSSAACSSSNRSAPRVRIVMPASLPVRLRRLAARAHHRRSCGS